jgi:hypothetical protein
MAEGDTAGSVQGIGSVVYRPPEELKLVRVAKEKK